MNVQDNGIDFVIIWVDGNDPAWRVEKNKYSPDDRKFNINDVRYRDWDLLHYLFRGIEKFAPWVRKVHLVTCGHVPPWLNLEHPKLNFVRHSDYIPPEFLPTFSSHPIELNLHRIQGLSERFVYFNDDTFLIAPVQETDFFEDGLPRNLAILNPPTPNRHGISTVVLNDLGVIADHFQFTQQMKKYWKKWFHPRYGIQCLRTCLLLPWRRYLGFYDPHLPAPFLKSTFEKVWKEEEELLKKVSSHRFRDDSDVNQYLMSYWQIASGMFQPGDPKIGKMFDVASQTDRIEAVIRGQEMKMLCVNDSEALGDISQLHDRLVDAFESILKEKCTYEK